MDHMYCPRGGRYKGTWIEVVKKDLAVANLTEDTAHDGSE